MTGPRLAAAGEVNRADGQRAYMALAARPQVTPTTDPDTHRLVTRNMHAVEEHARRLGYRVTVIGRVIRLVRIPMAGQVTLPPPPVDPPSRQVLSLACLLAAACEETAGRTTIAKLSELVGQLTAAPDSPVGVYDQARVGHRRTLLHAATLLQHWGVLVRQVSDDRLLGDWEATGAGMGTVYTVNREALLLLTNPDVLADVLEHRHTLLEQPPVTGDPRGIGSDDWAASRALRLLRALVECPAVCYADIETGDAESLRTMRGLRTNDAVTITGGHVEARAEGLVLILPDTHPAGATVDWPRAESRSWAALVALDDALRTGQRDDAGRTHLSGDAARALTAAIATGERARFLTAKLRDNVDALHEAVVAQLGALGLLRTTADGSWLVSATAARYRNPTVTDTPTDTVADTSPDPAGDRDAPPRPTDLEPTA